MIAFLDTSAFTKLLFAEAGSDDVREFLAAAEGLAGSRLLTVEARGAIARRTRERRVTAEDGALVRTRCRRLMERVSIVELDAPLAESSAELLERHTLRSSDAVHLASAVSLGSGAANLVFVVYDERLRAAARAEHLEVFPT